MRPAVPLPRLLACLLVAWAAAQASWAAWRQDWTYDERFHLDWSRRLIDERVTERGSTERFNSKTPISALNVVAERTAAALGVRDPRGLRLAARLPGVFWLLAVFAATYGLARALFGEEAAWVAVGIASLDPNLIAHASLVTVDVPYAAATALALWAAVAWGRGGGARGGILLGLALGLALLTKFTALLLLPGLLFLPLAWTSRPRAAVFRGAMAAAAAIWLVIGAGYLFACVGAALGNIRLGSAPLTRLAAVAPGLPVPLPADFLTGIDRSLVSERAGWNVVLFGSLHPQGVWYYFPALWLLKTPIALVLAEVAGLVLAIRHRRLAGGPAAFLLANLLLHAGYFSFLFKAQIGYRFVLMLVPLLCALAACGLSGLAPTRRTRALGLALVVLALAEGLPYLGNPLAFTNTAVFPKHRAFRFLADSNLDWGQNRDKVAGWLERRGIPASRLDPPHLLSGTNVIGVNHAAGVWDYERHRWLRENAAPFAHLGHSYLLYEVDEPLYERVLSETRRVAPSEAAQRVCGSDSGEHVAAGRKVPFAIDGVADVARAWLVCVSTPKGTDLGLRGFRGAIRVRPLGAAHAKVETVFEDQVAWYRLDTGTHAFVAQQVPNRRAWLPAAFVGEWHVRGRGARISIREGKAPDYDQSYPFKE